MTLLNLHFRSPRPALGDNRLRNIVERASTQTRIVYHGLIMQIASRLTAIFRLTSYQLTGIGIVGEASNELVYF